MKLRRLDPKEIIWPEVRVTAKFPEDLYQQFQGSIKAVGQVAPIICCQVDEKFMGVDGKHRCDEAIANGTKAVDVVVIPGDMSDVLSFNLFLDHTRGKTPVSEMVTVIKSLYEEYNLDIERIQEKTGLTRDYVERLIKISTASPEVLKALDQGVIGVGHAFELSRLPLPIQQEELLAKQQIYRFPVKEFKGFIDQVLAGMKGIEQEDPSPGPGEPPKPRIMHCEGCKEETNPQYLRPVLVCPDCFGAVWKLSKARSVEAAKNKNDGEGD